LTHSSITFLDILLGTAFVHYYAPKHHPKALKLLDAVLADHPDSVPCFMGRGYIFAGEQRWNEARLEFEKVITLENKRQDSTAVPKEGQPVGSLWSASRLEATEQQGWCMTKEGMLEDGIEVLQSVAEVFDTDVARKTDSARVWWRIGVAQWEMGGKSRSLRCRVQVAYIPLPRRRTPKLGL
jgi:superkiller protein 3